MYAYASAHTHMNISSYILTIAININSSRTGRDRGYHHSDSLFHKQQKTRISTIRRSRLKTKKINGKEMQPACCTDRLEIARSKTANNSVEHIRLQNLVCRQCITKCEIQFSIADYNCYFYSLHEIHPGRHCVLVFYGLAYVSM